MVRKSDRYDMTLIVLTGPFNSKPTNNLKTNCLGSTHNICTDTPFYTDTRYNDKIRYMTI